MAESDEDLMLAVRRGEWAAFDTLTRRHQATAWRIACRFLGDRAEAEDISQQAFLKILEASPRYEPTARFTTYLHQVVTRLCIDRSRKDWPDPLGEFDGEAAQPTPMETRIVHERDEAVRRGLDSLPPAQRLALILRTHEGLDYRGIALALGVTEKAVERLLARARSTMETRLSNLLERQGEKDS